MDRLRETVTSKFRPSLASRTVKQDELIVVAEEKKAYPPWATKLGNICFTIWNRGLWQPFRFCWNFLDRYTNITFWIFVGIFVGILVGYFQPEFAKEIKPLGTAFIRMIQIIVAPLIFSMLVMGIAGNIEAQDICLKLTILPCMQATARTSPRWVNWPSKPLL